MNAIQRGGPSSIPTISRPGTRLALLLPDIPAAAPPPVAPRRRKYGAGARRATGRNAGAVGPGIHPENLI
jgi:hypothetical protein